MITFKIDAEQVIDAYDKCEDLVNDFKSKGPEKNWWSFYEDLQKITEDVIDSLPDELQKIISWYIEAREFYHDTED